MRQHHFFVPPLFAADFFHNRDLFWNRVVVLSFPVLLSFLDLGLLFFEQEASSAPSHNHFDQNLSPLLVLLKADHDCSIHVLPETACSPRICA